MTTMAMPGAPSAETGSARAAAVQSQRAAAGWLRLQRDQWDAGRRAAAIEPPGSAGPGTPPRQDAIRYRETLLQEERELQTLRRAERRTRQSAGPAESGAREVQRRIKGRLIRQQEAREAKRLRMRTERFGQGAPRGLSGRDGRNP